MSTIRRGLITLVFLAAAVHEIGGQLPSRAELTAEIERVRVLVRIASANPPAGTLIPFSDATATVGELEQTLKNLYIAGFAGGWLPAPTGGLDKPFATLVSLDE